MCNSHITLHESGLSLCSKEISFYFCKLLCSLGSRRGNCKKVSVGLQCEVGLRCRTYYALCGSVLSVWNEVELVLAPVSGTNVKVQIVRLRTEEGQRIVGKFKTTIREKMFTHRESKSEVLLRNIADIMASGRVQACFSCFSVTSSENIGK